MLRVKNLNIKFKTTKGIVTAVKDVSFSLDRGETLGVVGESGCGKSITNMAIMGLLPPEAIVTAEELSFDGKSLLKLSQKEWQLIRGPKIGMIFQDPMSALNPCFTIEKQLAETIQVVDRGIPLKRVKQKSIELLSQVGIPSPESRLKCYPHELSGGMAQRVMIAMAIAAKPQLLIADEPTTALDVTIQLQILKLLHEIQKENKMSIIFVTHDLAVVSQISKKIQVLYAGEIVEKGETKNVLQSPMHPYTHGLLSSLPSDAKNELTPIPGIVPSLHQRPTGCQFSPRCEFAEDNCRSKIDLIEKNNNLVRCIKPILGS